MKTSLGVGAYLGADGLPLDPGVPADAKIAAWQSSSAYYVAPSEQEKHKHIVDILIRERAQTLSRSRFWPLYRLFLNRLLGYRNARRMVDTAGRWDSERAFAHASTQVGAKLDVTGLEHIPRKGAFIIALNHPTGIADGLAIHDALLPIRDDVIVLVNADAIRLNPRLTDKLIPVEWRHEKKSRAKSRETLVATKQAFAQGRAIVLFPSGRLACMSDDKTLVERDWMPAVATLARKYDCPIVPAHITARNSWLFYWFNNIHHELRDMTLFHELLNKRGKTFRIRIMDSIQPEQLMEDDTDAARELRAYVCVGIEQDKTFEQWQVACNASVSSNENHP